MTNSVREEENQIIIGTLVPQPQKSKEEAELDFVSSTIAKMQADTDGMDILLEMVKKNKLDPWNIDIVDLAEKYFEKMIELKQNNLHITGSVILFASRLLRLKSDILEGYDPFPPEIDESQNDIGEITDIEEDFNTNNVISLDEVLKRRTSVRLNHKRNVTLDELIKHLKFYQKLDKEQKIKSALTRHVKRRSEYADFTPDDIIDMAQDDEIEQNVDMMRNVLTKMFITEEKVEMKELNTLGLDKISVYLTLLFLSARDKIELMQEEFYSDLYIMPPQMVQLDEVIQ